MKLTQEELNKLLEEAPKDKKGRPIIPDAVFMENLKELPNGILSDTGKLSGSKGYIELLQPGTQKTKEIASMGGTKAQENNAKRRSWAESIDIFLKKTDENGVSNQDKIVEAMARKALDGCVGASEFLRDTVGEKPSESLNLDVMTDGDKELMANLMKRLNDGQGSVKK